MLQVQIKRGPCFDLDLKIEFKISTYPIYIQHVQYGAYMTEGSKIWVQIRTLHRVLCMTLNFNIKAWFKVTALHSLTWGQSFVKSELDLTKERENMVQNLFKDLLRHSPLTWKLGSCSQQALFMWSMSQSDRAKRGENMVLTKIFQIDFMWPSPLS